MGVVHILYTELNIDASQLKNSWQSANDIWLL